METEEVNARDAREDAEKDIAVYLMSVGIAAYEAKNTACLLLSKYEITDRCTAVAEVTGNKTEVLIKRFIIAKMVAGRTERTLKYYETTLTRILQVIAKEVEHITADDVRLYIALRAKKDGISDVTAGNEIRVLRSFFAWLQNEEIVIKNPMLKLETIKQRKTKKKALTDEEVEKLRYSMQQDVRVTAMMEVLLSTGCRVTELVNICIDEIDGSAVLVHGKGNKDRYVYLNTRARMSVERYLGLRADNNPYLFPASVTSEIGMNSAMCKAARKQNWWTNPDLVSADRHLDKGTIECIFRKYAKLTGVDRANPHKFRRTCATMALRRGMPIEQVSKMLGHEQLDTTRIYLDLSEEDLRQAHKRYVI